VDDRQPEGARVDGAGFGAVGQFMAAELRPGSNTFKAAAAGKAMMRHGRKMPVHHQKVARRPSEDGKQHRRATSPECLIAMPEQRGPAAPARAL